MARGHTHIVHLCRDAERGREVTRRLRAKDKEGEDACAEARTFGCQGIEMLPDIAHEVGIAAKLACLIGKPVYQI